MRHLSILIGVTLFAIGITFKDIQAIIIGCILVLIGLYHIGKEDESFQKVCGDDTNENKIDVGIISSQLRNL